MITNEIKTQCTQKINAWVKPGDNDYSQNTLASHTGVNAANISLIKRGLYVNGKSPISDDVFMKLCQFFDIQTGSGSQVRHFNNDNFIRVQAMCATLQRNAGIGFLDSEMSGAGKTYGLHTYVKLNPAKVIYIKATSTTGANDLLNTLLRALGVTQTRMSAHAKMETICDRMSFGMLLVIDELETCRRKAEVYGLIKDLADNARGKFGMIASGFGLIRYFERKAALGKNGYTQLHSRLNATNMMLTRIQEHDLKQIFSEFGGVKSDVIKWVKMNINDYRKLQPLLDAIIQIDRECATKEERESALNSLVSPVVEITADLRAKYSLKAA
jgi:hypothetical protein